MIAGPGLYQVALMLSLVLFAAVTAAYLRSGRASMFHPATVYLAFHALTFVVRPLVAFYGHYDLIYRAYDFQPSWSDKLTVILAANLGLIVFTAAALGFGSAAPRFARHDDDELRAYVKPTLITAVVLGVPAVMSLAADLGGSIGSQRVLDLRTGVTINTTSNGYFAEAQLMLATLSGIIAYVFRFRWWSLLPAAAFVLFRAGVGGRGAFIVAIFFLILLYLHRERRRWLTGVTVFLAAVALVLFRWIGDDRGAAVREFLGYGVTGQRMQTLRFLESMDWANMEFFEFLVYAIPQRTGTYDYFVSLLQVFTEPVPRVLWQGKPLGAPIKLFSLYDYGFPIGITFSLPGSGWYELGWFGVIIICAVFGWIYGKAYNKFMRSAQSPFAVMLFCAFASTAIVSVRDGTLLTILRQSLFYLAPVLLVRGLHNLYASRAGARGHAARAATSGEPVATATPRARRRQRAAGAPLAPAGRRSRRVARLAPPAA